MDTGIANGEGQAAVLNRKLTIVMVGAFWDGSTALYRRRALEALGHHVIPIDVHPGPVPDKSAILPRVRSRLFRLGLDSFSPRDTTGANRDLVAAIRRRPDLIWLDKALTIEASTLARVRAELPDCLLIGYSPDDMNTRLNQSRQFLEQLPLYDRFFTTKSFGVSELRALGCRSPVFVPNAFDEDTHKPWSLNDEERMLRGGRVGFIGNYESHRGASLLAIAAAGIPVRVWGPNWFKLRRRLPPGLTLEGKGVWGREYALTICSFDINLGFLSKANRDRQTTRTVEIPACGGFMLAERTSEHLEMFVEGEEAEFFGSTAELIRKVRHYLNDPKARQRIAAAGRARCLSSGYSNRHRVAEMLAVAQAVRTETT